MIFLLSGYKGSGKDTLALELVERYGYRRVAFADILKQMVSEQYGIDINVFHDQKFKDKPLEQYPVLSKDDFSANIHSFMYKEFRNKNGEIPKEFKYLNSNMVDQNSNQLYWTPRALLILEGSIKRSVNSDFWVKKAFSDLRIKEKEKIVVTDFRYKSEYIALQNIVKNLGIPLVTVRIERFTNPQSNDPSERDLDNFQHNMVLRNFGTLEDFLSISIKEIIKKEISFELCDWV